MSDPVTAPIQLEAISKCYRIFQNPQDRFKQALLDRFHGVLGKKTANQYYREHWALRDVSFELQPGEAVGILGHNGAGKSTLLQIIAGTLEPTSGSVKTSGRITALLELGSGFNPEFTGRENVFLNAQILGMSREDALTRFDDIANFADIGDFIDQPVKTYSSGMMMRLAFSVQTAIDPKILIVDEALAVGDLRFQNKCFAKLRKMVENGVSLLLVSHDVNTVASICNRAVILDKGVVTHMGDAPSVAKSYIAKMNENKVDVVRSSERLHLSDSGLSASETRFGNSSVNIKEVWIEDANNKRVTCLESGRTYRIKQLVYAREDIVGYTIGFTIKDKRSLDVFGASSKTLGIKFPKLVRGQSIEIEMEVKTWLSAGEYFLQAGCAGFDGEIFDCRINALHFTVVGTHQLYTTSIVNLEPRLKFAVGDTRE